MAGPKQFTEGYRMLAVEDLIPTPDNPRQVRDKKHDEGLAATVGRDGILQPVIVRRHPSEEGKWDLRAGGRRLAAAIAAGLKEIPCIVRIMGDTEALRVTVIENFQRQDLTPMESAQALDTLARKGLEVGAIAEEIGKRPGWVARRRQLLKLSKRWQKAALNAREAISEWPARMLEMVARLPAPIQKELLAIYRSGQYHKPTIPRRAELEKRIGNYTHQLARAPWKKDDATVLPEVSACSECLNRTAARPSLFDDLMVNGDKRDDRCLDPKCWERKAHAHLVARATQLREEHGQRLVYVYEGHVDEAPEGVPAGHPMVDKWRADRCKKSAKGARPCIRINGAGIGEFFYAHVSLPADRSRMSKGPKAVQSLARRRDALNGRRAKALIALVLPALDSDDRVRKSTELVRLAATFGTSNNVGIQINDTWKGFELTGESSTCREARVILWERIKPVLHGRLNFHDVAGAARKLGEAKRLCDYLGLDYAAMWGDVCQEIPEPRKWEKLNEDGTPKKATVRRKAKTSTPAEEKAKKPKPERGVCRECGCTHGTPCLTDGEPCAWADETETICTACASKKPAKKARKPKAAAAAAK